MFLRIEKGSAVPISRQIAEQIATLCASGTLRPGERLPSVRELARELAERVRLAVAALDTHGIGPITMSAGVARFEHDYDFSATLKTADRRLYQAKAGGRNCVV